MQKIYDLFRKKCEGVASEEELKEFEFLRNISCIDTKKLDHILKNKYIKDDKRITKSKD